MNTCLRAGWEGMPEFDKQPSLLVEQEDKLSCSTWGRFLCSVWLRHHLLYSRADRAGRARGSPSLCMHSGTCLSISRCCEINISQHIDNLMESFSLQHETRSISLSGIPYIVILQSWKGLNQRQGTTPHTTQHTKLFPAVAPHDLILRVHGATPCLPFGRLFWSICVCFRSMLIKNRWFSG
jgi:uncharacterized Zn-finger protein